MADKKVPRNAVPCRGCADSGSNGVCSRCKGEGEVQLKKYEWESPCRRCDGSGVCPGCGGSGWVVIGDG